MIRRAAFLAGALAFLFATPASAQEFWDKKPWREWSEKECKKMLEDSPWAKQQIFTGEFRESGRQGISQQDSGREYIPTVTYRIQLRSAVPLRKGLVRQMMLAAKYDKMTDEQKKNFDDRAEQFLAADFSDRVIVHVTYGSNVVEDNRNLNRLWQGFPEGTVPQEAHIIRANGKYVDPITFTPNRNTNAGEFQLVFPRLVEEQPIVTPQDKRFSFTLPHRPVHNEPDTRVLVEFKVEKMIVGGAVAF